MEFNPEPQPETEPPRPSRRSLSSYWDLLRQPRYLALAAFVGGLLFGWLVIGWWLYPVQYVNGSPEQLRADYREDFLRAAIDSYSLHADDALAKRRLDELGAAADQTMASVAANPGEQNIETISHFQTLLGSPVTVGTPQVTPSTQTRKPLFSTGTLLTTLCGITIVLGLALGAITLLRRRQGEKPAALKARDYTRGAPATDFAAAGESAPLSQWMTTYLAGDDLFDDSFSIDSPAGEFLGECGVGIAETIGVGTPKRVSAFEIWLFDKNDIQTVTKVLMSSHTFRDVSARERLAAKGEPVLSNSGVETVLETKTLQMVARVVDMQYGEGALPEESFFERVTLELAVWSKK